MLKLVDKKVMPICLAQNFKVWCFVSPQVWQSTRLGRGVLLSLLFYCFVRIRNLSPHYAPGSGVHCLTLCMMGISHAFGHRLIHFKSKSTFFFQNQNSSRLTFRLSNSLDPDQDQSDMGPNCFQRLSPYDTSRQGVKKNIF